MGKTIKTFGQVIVISFSVISLIVLMVLLSYPLLFTGEMAVGVFVGIVVAGVIIGLPLMAFGELMMDVKDIKILLMAQAKNDGITSNNGEELLEDVRVYTAMTEESRE